MTIKVFLVTKSIDDNTKYVYYLRMVKYMESGIAGRDLGFHYLKWIKNLAIRSQIKGIVFTRPDGSIRVVAEGEERNLMEFANKLEREGNGREIENFYIKWGEQNKDLENFHVVVN